MWSFRGWGGSSQQEEQAQNYAQQQQQPQEEEEEDVDEDDEYEEDEDPEETRFIERMLADVQSFGISFSQLDQRSERDALRLLGWACKSKAAPGTPCVSYSRTLYVEPTLHYSASRPT